VAKSLLLSKNAKIKQIKAGSANAELSIIVVANRAVEDEIELLMAALAESNHSESSVWLAKLSRSWGEAVNQTVAKVGSELVLVLDLNMQLSSVDIDELVRVHRSTQSAATAPAVIKRLGTIVDAGCVVDNRGLIASPLQGFSVDDLPAIEAAPVSVLASPVLLFSRGDFLDFASGPVGPLATARFSVALARATGKPLTMAYRAKAVSASATFEIKGKLKTGGASEKNDKRIDIATIAARAGFVFNQQSKRIERLPGSPSRWAVKVSAPIGPLGESWGDTFFARHLSEVLNSQGIDTLLDYRDTETRPESDYLDDVRLVIRGLRNVPINRAQLSPNAVNVLWVISHPELVTVAELAEYDLVFAASATWASKMTEQLAATGSQVQVLPLLQATSVNPTSVTATIDGETDLSSDVLFIGNTRHTFRDAVREAVAAGANLSVYGKNWDEFIDARYIRGENLPNRNLPQAYASARIVLNDHWADMREAGFISNRLFDAVASGARVLSDQINDLDVLFEGAVQIYNSSEEFASLVNENSTGTDGNGGHWPSDAELREIAARVAENHSFKRRAAELIAAVDGFRASRQH